MKTQKLSFAAAAVAVMLTTTVSASDIFSPPAAGSSDSVSTVTCFLDDSVYGSAYTEDAAAKSDCAAPCGDSCCSDCGDGCCSQCGDSCCSCGGADCCLGDPCTLHEQLTPCCKTTYGGWVQFGYHSDNTGLSSEFNDQFDYNDVPDRLNWHQAWLYVERLADPDCCSADWGYRFDIMYGTDAQEMQATGNPRADVPGQGRWDASFDHSSYGWAMPQAYAQAAVGDWSVIGGYFISPVGYEYVTAPQNFFYSHSLSSFNSEPFTHTGVLATYAPGDELKVYAGWTLGWDSAFDQFGGGSNFLGGFETQLSDGVTFAYLLTAGNFGYRSGNESGYAHGTYVTLELSDSLEYGVYSAYVDSDGSYGDPNVPLEDVSVVNYLFYTINDCWSLGGRVEWWKSNQVTGDSTSFYELTGGINYKPHANVTIRPEIRYDWTPSEDAVDAVIPNYNREIFGVDVVLTF